MLRKFTLSICLLTALALNAFAQQQDFSKVEIKTTKVAGNVYMLEGSGGNIGVSVGNDGVLIVDDQFAPLAEKIRAALEKLTQLRLRFVLNTHHHGDHTGGNEVFGETATIVAHSNVRKRLAANEKLRRMALPVITFDQTLSVHFNGEEIQAIHYPNGHTDGDGIIWFKNSNVVHLGDHMMTGVFPFIDSTSGGSLDGWIKNIGAIIERLPADIKIIPGHGRVASLDDLKQLHKAVVDSTAFVRKQLAEGKDTAAIKAIGLPAEFKSWGSGFISSDVWVETVARATKK
ncbi:MAG: MBL fold metallo-hydrolase [Acidobacteria bacterium]|nr:MBL fold metallo-hydrolase [Acidobacteriota bacterium]